jgi:tetratricopeptide (TPR) repeat protein
MISKVIVLVAASLLISTQAAIGETSALCAQGETLFNDQNYPQSQDALWQCIITGAQTPDNALHLAWTYRDLKNYDQGLARAADALKQDPHNEDLLYLAAFLHFRRGELEASVGFLNQAYRLKPDDWRIHQLYALNFVEVGWSAAVEQELERAIKLKPDMPELYYQLARYYYTMSKFEKAISASAKALELSPDYANVYDNLGLSYAGLSDPARAAENFSKAIAINEQQHRKDEWPLVDYGAFLEDQDLTKAQLTLEHALQMNPANATANYELGRTMQRLGRDAEAEKYLTAAIKIDPSYTSAYWILSNLVRKRGDRALAAKYLEQFKELKDKDQKDGVSQSVLSMQHR